MIIAQEKRKTNIIEYILYMWQVEDIIRACQFDINILQANVISQFNLQEGKLQEVQDWYQNLISMMENDACKASGHITILKELVRDLDAYHQAILRSGTHGDYNNYYLLCQRSLSEFKQKAGDEFMGDVEAGITALYGVLMMRLKRQKISEETIKAANGFTRMLAKLSDIYLKVERGEAELDF